MRGSRRLRVILQQRDLLLLDGLPALRIVDRDQVMRLLGFTSIQRANARLQQLVLSGHLGRFFIPSGRFGRKAIYHGVGTKPWSERAVSHQLAVNSIHLALIRELLPEQTSLSRWVTPRVQVSDVVPLIPDGYFELRIADKLMRYFLEVDLGTEPLKVVKQKAEAYLRLAIHEGHVGPFRVLFVVSSERRLRTIQMTIGEVTPKLFFLAELSSIQREGLFKTRWIRPTGAQQSPIA
jgi:hypothetical protein